MMVVSMVAQPKYRIGLISDTHGLLRPEAFNALAGSHLIIHAGDVGPRTILKKLEEIAPVFAVRGNIDIDPWTTSLPRTATVETPSGWIYLIHNRAEIHGLPMPPEVRFVVYGHTHKPLTEEAGIILYIDPGAAGPRRFRLPVCIARLELTPEGPLVEHIDLTTGLPFDPN